MKDGTFTVITDSPVGALRLTTSRAAVTGLTFVDGGQAENAEAEGPNPLMVREALAQLGAYFAGTLKEFDLPIEMVGGTPFQRRVWTELRAIPFGQTWSYAELARHIGRPKAVRAVGAANGANPICIIIPCHRVIGADGSLTGFGGGLGRKSWLLRHEGIEVASHRERPIVGAA
jgi:methylated-DNA-[protein]-cysteine S-methyltransferase